MTADTRQQDKGKRLSLRRAWPIMLIVLVAVPGFFLLSDHLNFETLRENREALIEFRERNAVATALAYMLAYVAMVAFSLPGGVWLTLAGGFVFGAALATGLTVIAATTGATILFLAAKTSLGDALHARMMEKTDETGLLRRIERGLHRNEISVLLLIRLVPVVPFFVANLAPAFLGIGLRNYVLTTFIGIIPGTAVFAWLGAGLGTIFAQGGTPDLGIIFSWPVLGPILGLAGLSALPIVIRLIRGGEAL